MNGLLAVFRHNDGDFEKNISLTLLHDSFQYIGVNLMVRLRLRHDVQDLNCTVFDGLSERRFEPRNQPREQSDFAINAETSLMESLEK